MTTHENHPRQRRHNPLLPPNFYKQRDWIDTLLPHESIGKRARPLFALEVRGMHRRPDDLKAVTLRQIKRMAGGALLVYAVMLVTMVLIPTMTDRIYTLMWAVIACLVAFSLVEKFVLDFAGLQAGVQSHRNDRVQQELVLLTGLRNEEIVHARHAAAQVRAWGVLVFVVSLRVIAVLLLTLTIVVPSVLVPSHVDPLFSPHSVQLENPVSTISTALGLLWLFGSVSIGGAIYVLEPLWRLRALAAAGLLAASVALPELEAERRSVHAARMLLRLWGREVLVIGAGLLAMAMTLGVLVLVLPLWFAAIGWFLYDNYERLTARWLREAHRVTTLDAA